MKSLYESLKDLDNRKKEYKRRDEISYHLPEWIHLMVEYFNKNYAQKSLLYEKKSEYEKPSNLYNNN